MKFIAIDVLISDTISKILISPSKSLKENVTKLLDFDAIFSSDKPLDETHYINLQLISAQTMENPTQKKTISIACLEPQKADQGRQLSERNEWRGSLLYRHSHEIFLGENPQVIWALRV